ncbi:MAG TPA: hypothetical protein VM468_00735 [Mycoplana sp.]|nr:hypothetical protein [Mycoplana sp.]
MRSKALWALRAIFAANLGATSAVASGMRGAETAVRAEPDG